MDRDFKFENLMLEQIKMLTCHLGKGVANVQHSFVERPKLDINSFNIF
jgi:hypothetical protein